ncbi:hypothetical protein [Dokdonella ginsengisoli]|uniref:Uncharacterized protein n=1 Tax=Dokdonella ginsengisoli TaxID=363846 RepID=A0ABV9QYU2_9GAMM
MPRSSKTHGAPTSIPTFVPRAELEPKSWRRRIYQIDFSQETRNSIHDAIEDASGVGGRMVWHLLSEAMETIRDEHQLLDTHVDDAYIYLCEQVGIDVEQFPKLTKVEPVGFFQYVVTELPHFSIPRSEVQWKVQSSAYWKCWKRWTALQCEGRGGCAYDDHRHCDEIYVSPHFWGLAQSLEREHRAKEKLLASIDVSPSRKAAKTASESLARISIASREARS